MESYIIADRGTETTLYYAGLNGWVNLPENAIWYSKSEAFEQKKILNKKELIIEIITH